MIRLLHRRAGRLCGSLYRLEAAYAFPAPTPPPRIIVGGKTPVPIRRPSRRCLDLPRRALRRTPPGLEAELAAAGRARADVPVLVAVEVEEAPGSWLS